MTDDRRDDDIPTPDAPETEAERARARSFARLVDGLIDGEATPPALAAEDREMLETASLVRAAVREPTLDAQRTRSIIDQAFGAALGLAPAPAAEPTDELGKKRAEDGPSSMRPVRPERNADRRSAWSRRVPWAVAGLAAAAAIAFAVVRPGEQTRTVEQVIEQPAYAEIHRSRPASPLVGRIDKSNADRASDRIDLIVADRMAGYRDLYLRGKKGGSR